MNIPASMKEKISWLDDKDIRPYIYMREDNLLTQPGERHHCDWFKQKPIIKNPLLMREKDFGDAILRLESRAFGKAGMEMPRWVFYDCAIIPGFVCGFAKRTETLSAQYKKVLNYDPNLEWTPLSLFIIIPTVRRGEWVAHNLSSVNSLVDRSEKLYALGFLTKAFGLWYSNVEILCGFLQWGSPAIRLHSHYGLFEVLTSYTPVHSYAQTLSYRCRIDAAEWPTFFKGERANRPYTYVDAGFQVSPTQEESLIHFQSRVENGEGPYYLNPQEIRQQPLDQPYKVYRLASDRV